MTRYMTIAKAAGMYAAETLPPLLAAEAWRNRGLTFWAGTCAVVTLAILPEAALAMHVFQAIH
ncbi:MAG: hypothetical protein JWM80_3321 [Cyanobacteria bacterium RYN_339]|nr:hypothetical protein [Cyanobacteria bacterium RYN_339]